MTAALDFLLIDRQLAHRHRDLIARMADELLRQGVTSGEADAVRALMGHFSYGAIVALTDDALFEARQRAVSPAMRTR